MIRKLKCTRKYGVVLSAIMLISAFALLTACGETEEKKEQVTLSVWSSEASTGFVREVVEDFKKEHEGEADFQITVSEESELSCKETVLANPRGAADLFAFADDQFQELRESGVLAEVTYDTGNVVEENGGANSYAILSCEKDGKLYAYPLTAGNGYFLYYNSAYFKKEDVASMKKMLAIAAKNNKKVMMDFTSGWYIYSFFKGAGLDVTAMPERDCNDCNWNATDTKYKGVDVAEAMLSIANNKGFKSGSDDEFVQGVEKGTVIAGINGAWNATKVEKAMGENYAATKLPTYTVAGDEVQMKGFIGFKLVGVNAYSKYPEWAMKLARYISNEENQIKRFHLTGECPSNTKAADIDEVKNTPAIAALKEMAEYSQVQKIRDTYWIPSNVFGTVIANGNKDKKDLQELLDELVKEVSTPPAATK